MTHPEKQSDFLSSKLTDHFSNHFCEDSNGKVIIFVLVFVVFCLFLLGMYIYIYICGWVGVCMYVMYVVCIGCDVLFLYVLYVVCIGCHACASFSLILTLIQIPLP